MPVAEAREKGKALAEKYGRDTMEKAARELLRVEEQAQPPMVYLTDEARKLCVQLLGSPPGSP